MMDMFKIKSTPKDMPRKPDEKRPPPELPHNPQTERHTRRPQDEPRHSRVRRSTYKWEQPANNPVDPAYPQGHARQTENAQRPNPRETGAPARIDSADVMNTFMTYAEQTEEQIQYKEQLIQHRDQLIQQKEQQIQQKEQQIKALQDVIGRQMSESWMPEEDRKLDEMINHFHTRLWQWAKTNATGSYSIPPADQEVFWAYLSDSGAVKIKNGKLPDGLLDASMGRKTPSLLLAATLSKSIYAKTIDNRFAPFYAIFDKKDIVDSLGELWEQSHTRNAPGANTWRSQLYRAWFPKRNNSGSELDQKTVDAFHAMAEKIVLTTMTEPLRYLLRPLNEPDEKSQLQRLVALVFEILRFCVILGTQNAQFCTLGANSLLGGGFNSTLPTMEAHKYHQLNHDDRHMEGESVAVIVHPWVLALEDNQGSSRCISRAVVWMETEGTPH